MDNKEKAKNFMRAIAGKNDNEKFKIYNDMLDKYNKFGLGQLSNDEILDYMENYYGKEK